MKKTLFLAMAAMSLTATNALANLHAGDPNSFRTAERKAEVLGPQKPCQYLAFKVEAPKRDMENPSRTDKGGAVDGKKRP